MIKLIHRIAPGWFCAESSTSEPRAEFLLTPLNSVELLDLMNQTTKDADGHFVITGRGMLNAVQASVRDWRHVFDASGDEVKFDKAQLPNLPPNTLLKLSTEIINRSKLSDADLKNSSSPST